MSLLDKASLIVTPNGYSEDTLYSVVPSSGAGDLSFARATDAWRTNSQGLVQRVCWNLLQYSEQFENAAWSKSNGTITTNAILAPNGTLTADSFTKTSAINTVSQVGSSSTVFANIGVHTLSVYIKPNIGNEVLLRLDNSGNTANSSFNFTTKTFTNSGANIISSSFVELPNGWFRLSIVGNVTTLGWTVTPCNLFSNPLGDSMFIWGAQLVEGSSALEYFPTTDRQNVPRIDYSLGGCPTLLMEPQRTNIVLRSEEFDNASWSKSITTVTANSSTSPSGIQNADNISFTTTGSYIRQLLNTASATTYTASVYVKKSSTTGNNLFKFYYNNNSLFPNDGAFSSIIDLTNLTISTSVGGTVGTGRPTILSSQLINAGNDWYRAIVSFTTGTSAGSATSEIGFQTSVVVNFEAWGAQVEAGAYPTSYIPTTTASVTRNADGFARNNIYTNGLISASGGAWFVDLKNNVAMPRVSGYPTIYLSNTTNGAAGLVMGLSSSTTSSRLSLYFWQSGVFTNIGVTTTDNLKVAFTWTPTTLKVFVNGVLLNTYTGLTWDITTIQNLTGISEVALFINEIALFRTPLSDAECIKLTTL